MRNFIRTVQPWVALLGAIMLASVLASHYSDPTVHLTYPRPAAAAPVAAPTGPRECQFYVLAPHGRTIDVVLPFDRFRPSWPVTVEVVKGGAAWAQVAHANATTEFVRFTAPYAGLRTVAVGTTKCAVV